MELFLQRFDPASDNAPVRPDILSEKLAALRKLGCEAEIDEAPEEVDEPVIHAELLGGTATIAASFAQIPVDELDELTLRAVFDIAHMGDEVIVIEGGPYRAILTDASQRERIDQEWIEGEETPLATSAAHLGELLRPWFEKLDEFRRPLQEKAQTAAGPTALPPGSVEGNVASFIYVETRPNEKPMKQENRIGKYLQRIHKADAPHQPKKGIMKFDWWHVTLPDGTQFFGYAYGGDKENWLAMFKGFCAEEDRLHGQFENFGPFVVSDGRRFEVEDLTHGEISP